MDCPIQPNQTVLFQGDSITDAQRSVADEADLGHGYAAMAAATFQAAAPDRNVRFLNRGVGGNRVADLKARWSDDCIALKPDWVSILIGVNDTWRAFDQKDPTSTEQYAGDYRHILTRTRDELGARLILCEPFVLPAFEADYAAWRADLDPRIHAVRELAREFDALLVPFDGLLAAAACKQPPAFWAGDGVHPTRPGHALMARAWLAAVSVR
ncbi:MAG: SGNH/GDSL hydrolase family protein [Phycisphaerae bacterium]|nr:SGNH/GDSL hydrolase family protein [Phycisphaerae bacterium]